jgi:hypothetical protein
VAQAPRLAASTLVLTFVLTFTSTLVWASVTMLTNLIIRSVPAGPMKNPHAPPSKAFQPRCQS